MLRACVIPLGTDTVEGTPLMYVLAELCCAMYRELLLTLCAYGVPIFTYKVADIP